MLTDLPADSLADIISRLSLPQDALTFMLCNRFFASGEGRLTLSAAGLLSAARVLGCLPGHVGRLTGSSVAEDGLKTAAFVIRSHTVLQQAACADHTLVIHKGILRACGANSAGQLGNGVVSQVSSTISVPSPNFSSAYLARQQQVVDNFDATTPASVMLPTEIAPAAVAAGRSHSLLVSSAGEVYAWGLNDRGQLGYESDVNAPRPRRIRLDGDVSALDNARQRGRSLIDGFGGISISPQGPAVLAAQSRRVVQVAAGALHSLLLLDCGEVLACGAGDVGELGTGELSGEVIGSRAGTGGSHAPVRVELPEPARAIAAGGYHSLALSAGVERRVYGWGSAACGQIGPTADGSYELKPRATPTLVLLRGGGASAASMPWQPMAGGGPSAIGEGTGYSVQPAAIGEDALPPVAKLAAGLHHSLILTQARCARAHMHTCRHACGPHHSLILTQRGEVLSCGKGSNGAASAGVQRCRLCPRPSALLPSAH